MINVNGYTFASGKEKFEAALIDGNRIAAVGSKDELMLQYGTQAETVNLDGATVIPGLVDSHAHLAETGKQFMQLNLSSVRSKAELLNLIRTHAATLPSAAWVIGGGWDENRFVDRGLPTLEQLDEAAGGRPLLLKRICHHAYMANTQALSRAGLSLYPADPNDGRYGRDESGRFNGVVYENASIPIQNAVPSWSPAQWKDALRIAMNQALASGLTSVHSDDTRSFGNFSDTWHAYRSLMDTEGLRLGIHELVDWSLLDEAISAGPDLPQEDDWLELGAAKLFADGAFGGRTALLQEPYTDSPDWYGTAMYDDEELYRRVRYAHERGVPAAIHAIGDAALDMALTAIERAPRIKRRDRIVHAQMIRPDLVQRMRSLGSQLALDIQPRFVCSDFPWVVERVGSARAKSVCAWRTMQDAGLHLCGGSDSPIEPLQPLFGIHAAVTRRDAYASDGGYAMEQAYSPEEAIHLFSHGAVFATGKEQVKGTIAPGKLADFTVLDRDIVHPADVNDIRDAQVLHTIVGGEFAYSRNRHENQWSTA
ncbi:amidohydrolase [Alicyclobacillus sp. SO9]|uniref:amidohydrolase n=1 Tax=Alicyclobacillus sp. SO9 TaxID=2665646 RepID=UPI001E2FB1B0|nr:amidohydrolase [Alicyclobacillus sp. SO9]